MKFRSINGDEQKRRIRERETIIPNFNVENLLTIKSFHYEQ